jgi:hypothetical protein
MDNDECTLVWLTKGRKLKAFLGVHCTIFYG